jgi:RNA polymerase sigma factor (sigma-70 family)
VEELELITGLKNKQESAYALLVSQLGSRVYNTCLSLLQNTEDAEDVSQEVFVSVYQSIEQFKGYAKLSTWVYRIAVTRSLEHIRSRNRKKRFAFIQRLITSDSENDNVFEPGHFHHPGIQLENKERAAILFKALEQLPENQKTAFVLHKMEDLSYGEVAEILNVSLSSVESLMFRAKQNLRKLLGDYYEKNEK